MSTNTELINKINQTISKINSGKNPADRQNLQEICLAIIAALNGDYNALLTTVNTFTETNTFNKPIIGDIIGDVYAPNGTTKAVENASTIVGNSGHDPSTPVLYGRSIDTTTRTGVDAASAGSITAAAAASLNGRFGNIGIQAYAVNNEIFMENAWFDGSAFKYISNGSASRLYFQDGLINVDFAPLGTAGATAIFTTVATFSISSGLEVVKDVVTVNAFPIGAATCNTQAGVITGCSGSIAANSEAEITVTSSFCKANSVVMAQITGSTVTMNTDAPFIIYTTDVSLGFFKIKIRNLSSTNAQTLGGVNIAFSIF